MWKQCGCIVLLAVLPLVHATPAYSAFDPLADPALAGWWSFDEGAGTTAADSSTFARHGVLQGGTAWVPGRFGGGIELDGTNGYISVADFPLTTNAVTLVAWVKGWKANDWAGIVSGHPARLEMCFGDNDTLHYVWNNDAAATWSWRGAPVIAQDTWAMVAVTVDSTQAIAYVYTDDGGLTQGVNAMAHIAQTFTTLQMGWSFGNRYVRGVLDEVAVYSRALTEDEMRVLTLGPRDRAMASAPNPEDGAVDVPQDVALAWTPGDTAATHNIYFGTDYEDVNEAGVADPQGVLVSEGQMDAVFDPDGLLEFGRTYYWRIDEVNAAPDSSVCKGQTWSFAVETYSYPLAPAAITATASDFQPGMGPENTINGSGLTDDQHSTALPNMWMTTGGLPAWIQYEFDRVYKLDKLLVWNSNQAIESFLGFGAKSVAVEHSADGETWATLEGVSEFAKAAGTATYTANTTVDFGGAMVRFVRITIRNNWGGVAPQTGLSEVRFFHVPMQAFQPTPADDATGVSIETSFAWRPGREAVSHIVYVGADSETVADGTAAGVSVDDHAYTPTDLRLDTEYFWKVDEVSGGGTQAGDVWSFTTQEFLVVDDFESYNDAADRIYQSWVDGVTDEASGSQVGYDESPFAEKTIIHGGRQSMPLMYDNTSFTFSEARRAFDPAQDWTARGIKSLSLFFQGAADNTGKLYLRINSTKIVYDGPSTDIAEPQWIPWNIDLSAVGADLTRVASLTIGIEGAPATGTLYVDDVRLYPKAPEFITPLKTDDADVAAQ